MNGNNRSAIVIGAGLAGMSAALDLQDAGWRVTLLDSRRSLGGRAGSFVDPQTGQVLDNCQHVLLGCCTSLIDFYRRIGAFDKIRFHRRIHFLHRNGSRHDLWGLRFCPAPLHLLPAMLRFNLLSLSDRIALAKAMGAMMRLGKAGRQKWADKSFGDWLDAHRQPESLYKIIYEPLVTSALNEDCRRANAAYAIQVFQDALLNKASGYVLGLPLCPLDELYAHLSCRDVRLGQRITSLHFSSDYRNIIAIETAGEERIEADVVVLATDYRSARRLVPEAAQSIDSRFAHLDQLSTSPILAAHLWFDRPVLPWSHAALLDGPLQWIFRKDAQGSAVHGVISAARQWMGISREQMTEQFLRQLQTLLPGAKDAKLVRSLIVIERDATFAPLPDVDRFRPDQAPPPGGIENLYLTGDYTQTSWPATMEGAVRSGRLAAAAVLARAINSSPVSRSLLAMSS